jgi:class 3 adenylate cyclase
MSCPGCGRANRAGARFCGGCGRSLAPRCPACGSESEADAQFCDVCGASFVVRPTDDVGARKVVSIVFADLAGSTSLHERLDAESTRRFMDRYYRAMQGAVEAHGGTVTQLLGDGVKAVFGAPRVAEDDALRAVRAAVGMQRAFRELASEQSGAVGPVGLRVAVNTGEVVAKDETEIIGDPVNVAARLQQEAHDGDVLVGESTRRLVSELVTLEPFGTFALKGRAEPVAAWRVVSLERPAGVAAIAFVGREDELRRLVAVYDAAVAAPGARLAVILGSPGLGKSRLLAELARRLGDRATVLVARCDAAGGATFAPIAEALRALLRIDAGAGGDALRAAIDTVVPEDAVDRSRIADGVGALLAGTPGSPEETFFVVRRLLAALAAARPVLLAIDDLQWAEPLLLDLTEHLVQWSRDVPLLVLAAARPELREVRSSLATPGGLVADVVTLAGLDAGAATRLAANVIGADELPAAIAGRVLATSEGNPLFVGELVRMLVHDGALRREGDRWTAGVELATLEMPPTIHALLAARIERLRPEERTVLERAAVVGRHFSRSAVAQLLPPELRDGLDVRLESLRRSELVEPDTGWLLGEPVLRFHHVLIRDAAYRRLLKNTRAELHARFADWLEARVGDAVEHDETIGWHLEQAHQHLRELGPIDAQGRVVGERAARRLASAGRRALARDDLPLAASLLGRALDRLDPADPARADLALDWCEALLTAGEVGPAAAAIDELGRFIGGSDRLRAWHTCFAGQLAALTDPQALRATADAVAAAAVALESAGDAAGEAKAHSVHALALVRLGKVGACEAALDRALAAARRARDRRRANAVLAGAPLAALWGPSPVTRASGRCLDVVRVLRITQEAPAVEAVALRCQSVLEALRGRTEAARRMIASSRRMVEELGITQRLLEADVFAGLIELLEGDAVAAERCLRDAYDGLREHGLGIDAAQAAALLGRALLAQGRAAEAEALSHESEALAGDDLKAAIAWRGVRAEALARRGEHASAVDFARAAVDLAAATDALLDHADARLALAAALRAAGRTEEADAEEARAIELWEAKGATLLAERARRHTGHVTRADRAPENRLPPPRLARRGVPANAATAHAARWDAAIAARDAGELAALIHDRAEVVDHPTGVMYDRSGVLASLRILFAAEGLAVANEPLATLGESLALCRVSTLHGEIASDDFPPFGAVENARILLVEVDEHGRRLRAEFFAADHLGDAVARLYERHAELLPDGSARTRAAATARSVGTLLAPPDLDRWATAFAPAIEWVDHRTVGLGSVHGAEAVLRGIGALFQLLEGIATRVDEVLDLRDDAIVLRWTNHGTDRAGGAFERNLCHLWIFGVDGLLARWEQSDGDHDAEALARFDELAAEPPSARSAAAPSRAAERRERRVRANAATAIAARLDAAIAARDADALPALLADGIEHVHHPTGTTCDRQGGLFSLRSLLSARDPTCRYEPLATLGDSLALCHFSASASGLVTRAFDVGGYERQEIDLIEVDAQGRRQRGEFFASDRLGDAIARLYERYAELLPDGPERTRAAATARSVAVLPLLGPFDLDRYATAFAPAMEWVDHRTVGLGSVHGAEAVTRGIRTLLELTADFNARVEDVLDLRPDALLVRHTNRGTDRASGGVFERHFFIFWVFGVDGLLTRFEQFDADHEDEALARFDELTEELRATRLANAATRHMERHERLWRERDWDGVLASLAPMHCMDDRRPLTRLRLEAEQYFANLRLIFENASLEWRSEMLATRGERLALFGVGVEGDVDGAQIEFAYLQLSEVDADGRRTAQALFDPDDLDAAWAELDARYAAGEAAAHGRVSATMHAFRRAFASRDWDALAAQFAADLVVNDHRRLGWEALRGPAAYVQAMRSLVDLAPDTRLRLDHVRTSERGLFWVAGWLGTREGGPFQAPWISVSEHDGLGRVRRFDQYDLDQLDAALARYEDLSRAPSTPPRVENEATRALQRWVDASNAYDWERFVAAHAVGFRQSDRRRLMQLEGDRGPYLDRLRPMFEMASSRHTFEVLATRGNRLAMNRLLWEGSDHSVGPSEVDVVMVIEVDGHGDLVAIVTFDPDDLDAAYAELDDRYGAPVMRALARDAHAGDWDAVAARLAPDLVVEDHQRLGWETQHGPAVYIRSIQGLAELAPDARWRADHAEESERGALGIGAVVGSREGGAFEMPRVVVAEFDAQRRVRRFDLHDLDQLAAARARFEAIQADGARDPLAALAKPNAATAAMDRLQAAFAARDWAAVRALSTPQARIEDRRRHALVSGDVDWWVADLRRVAEADVGDLQYERRLVGTAGDRVCLERVLWSGGPAEGRVEIEYLWLAEVDESGRLVSGVMFDPEDWRAASREARARWLARDAAAARVAGPHFEFLEALSSHDRSRVRAAVTEDVVFNDRRRAGVGPVEGADAYLEALAVLWDLAPDIEYEGFVLALERHGLVVAERSSGTLREGGGGFERPLVTVSTVTGGRLTRLELFDVDDVDATLARLAELRPDPLRIPPNAATRAGDRFVTAFEAQDWKALEALLAPDLVFEDRRRRFFVTGDRDMLIANGRLIGSTGARVSRAVLATAGDRLALERRRWTGTGELAFEVETLELCEVDAEGRAVAVLTFDPDDRRAASAELFERHARSDAARWTPAAVFEFFRALNDHDLERCRAKLPDDFVFHDHRRTGVGRLEDADEYIASLTPLFERAPGWTIEALYYVAEEKHGTLAVARWFGTLAEGGEFETVVVRLVLYRGDRLGGIELFEPEDLDVARARFEELRPDPLRIPPNAATRARDRTHEAQKAGDWAALRALASPDFKFEDRGKRALVSGDVEMWIENNRLGQLGSVARELIGTAGDRIALERTVWTVGPDANPVEVEHLRLTEVDADGRIRASIRFDLDDRAAAFAEAHARFVAGEAAATGGQAPLVTLSVAMARHDWETLRGCLAPDAVVHDHRMLSLGELGPDQWVESLRVRVELAPDVKPEWFRILAWNRHGRVSVARAFGTLRDGGPFENVFVVVALVEGDRLQRFEIFDVADADRALARFEELCSERP